MKAATLSAIVLGSVPALVSAGCPATCSGNLQLSCHNTSAVQNTCCFNAPGGSLLQTQFWDYSPATGPADSWTLHGLWPDNCDGTFQENCDSKRAYKNISQILESYGQTSLLSFMNEYWKNDDGTDEEFWEHEWATHGTCISTFDTSCYTNYQPQEEVVDFFTRTTDLFKTLDTYTFLKNAGIVPAKGKTYSLKSVEAALSNAAGRNGTQPQISCDDSGALSQVYYYFNVRGSAQTGEFVAAPALEKSSCPSSVSYPPKPTNTQTSKPSSTASAKPTATLQGSCRVNEDWRPQPTRLFRA